MAEPLVCASCSASNPPTAKWCTLCFEPFRAPADLPAAGVEVSVPKPAESDQEPGRSAPPPPARPGPPPPPGAPDHARVTDHEHAPSDVSTGPVHPAESGVTWTCAFCDAVVPVEETECPVCHQSIYDSFGGGDELDAIDPKSALAWAAIPGGGHFKVGQGILGFTIGLLSIVSLAFGIVLVVSRRIPWGAAQIFIGIVLWAISVNDAYRYAEGDTDQVMLRPRVLSVVAGVWFIILIAAAVSAQGAIPE